MSAKVILFLCAQALFVQIAFSRCYGPGVAGLTGNGLFGNRFIGNGLIGDGVISDGLIGNGCASYSLAGNGLIGDALIGNGLSALEIIPTSGGALPVSSASAFAPSGVSIASENVFEGALSVSGELPFVSAVALEGVLPSGGSGAVSYSCGNGVTAIESIAPSAAAYGSGLGAGYGLGSAYGPGAAAIAPAALRRGYGSRSCGCGVY